MATWELVDLSELGLDRPEREAIPVRCELRLRSELRRLAGLDPRVVELVSTEREMLAVALLGPWAVAYWSAGPYVLRNRIVRSSRFGRDEPAGLLFRGHQLLVDAEALFPLEDAIELAAFIYQYQQLPIWVGACADAEAPPVFAGRASSVPKIPRGRPSDAICVLPSPALSAG